MQNIAGLAVARKLTSRYSPRGADMLLFSMRAISERRAEAGPSDRNEQSRQVLNGARFWGHYSDALLAPPHLASHTSQVALCMRHPPRRVSRYMHFPYSDTGLARWVECADCVFQDALRLILVYFPAD